MAIASAEGSTFRARARAERVLSGVNVNRVAVPQHGQGWIVFNVRNLMGSRQKTQMGERADSFFIRKDDAVALSIPQAGG